MALGILEVCRAPTGPCWACQRQGLPQQAAASAQALRQRCSAAPRPPWRLRQGAFLQVLPGGLALLMWLSGEATPADLSRYLTTVHSRAACDCFVNGHIIRAYQHLRCSATS